MNPLRFALRHHWQGWDEHGHLIFDGPSGEPVRVEPDATVLALGGASWPRLGSDGSWVKLLSRRGIAVSPGVAIGPALVVDTEGIRITRRTVQADQVATEISLLRLALDECAAEARETRRSHPCNAPPPGVVASLRRPLARARPASQPAGRPLRRPPASAPPRARSANPCRA